jgi:hypothetical protein
MRVAFCGVPFDSPAQIVLPVMSFVRRMISRREVQAQIPETGSLSLAAQNLAVWQ